MDYFPHEECSDEVDDSPCTFVKEYKDVIQELKERCKERDKDFVYDVAQTRFNFKRCISLCQKAALTIKTASGITRYQEEKDFGPRCEKLFQVVCTMDQCQPEQSIEPLQEMSKTTHDGDDHSEVATDSLLPSNYFEQTTYTDLDGTSKDSIG